MNTRGPQSAIAPLGWTQLPGGGVYAAASPDGSLWVLSTLGGPDHPIYHYVNGSWTNIPGAATRLAVAPDNTLWVVNSAGGIYHWSGSAWTTIAGGASDITVASDGSVYVISSVPSGPFGRGIWHFVNGNWTQMPGAGIQIAASSDSGTYSGGIAPGGFYVINAQLSIYYYNPTLGFQQLPGAAIQLAPTKNGGLFALGVPGSPNGNPIYYNDLSTGTWTQQPGAGVAVATDGTQVYVIGAAGGIYVAPVRSPSPTPSPVPSPISTSTPIVASQGGIVSLSNGSSVTIPAGALTSDSLVTLTHNPQPAPLPNPDWAAGSGDLTLSVGGMGTSARARRPLTRLQSIGNLQIKNVFPSSNQAAILDSSAILLKLTPCSTPNAPFYISPDMTIDTSTNSVSASVPASTLSTVCSLSATAAIKSSTWVQPKLGLKLFTRSGSTGEWSDNAVVQPNLRTLLLLHGLGNSVEDSFPGTCGFNIANQGTYDQVIGYDYDWTRRPSEAGLFLRNVLTQFPHQRSLDIEGHSYGAVVAIAALAWKPLTDQPLKNLVLVGGPLPAHGAPIASPAFVRFLFNNTAPGAGGVVGFHMTPVDAQFAGVMLADLSNSSVMSQLADSARLGLSQSGSPKIIEVAGTTFLDFEKNWGAPIPDDGIVDVASAASTDFFLAEEPRAAMTFPLFHTALPCNSDVQSFIKKSLAPPPPPPGLTFTGLTPTTIVSHTKPFVQAMTATGSNFTNLKSIRFVWSGATSGDHTWTNGTQEWNDKVTGLVDGSMTLNPTVVGSTDPPGISYWTVTLTDITNNFATMNFTVDYEPPKALTFTGLQPTAVVSHTKPFVQAMAATGSNFTSLKTIRFVWSGATSGDHTWTNGTQEWNDKVTGLVDGSMTLNPTVVGSTDPPGISYWTVTLTDITNNFATMNFTVDYEPPKALTFTGLQPTAIVSHTKPFVQAMAATGSNFTSLKTIRFVWSGATSGDHTWTNGTQEWNDKVTGLVDGSMTLNPTVVGSTDPPGISYWTVTLTDTTNNFATMNFTVDYEPPGLTFTGLQPTTISSRTKPLVQPLLATGSNFTHLKTISFVWSGVTSGNHTWTNGTQEWNDKVTQLLDGSMTLSPTVLGANDPPGTSYWTVTLTDTANTFATMNFTVTYQP